MLWQARWAPCSSSCSHFSGRADQAHFKLSKDNSISERGALENFAAQLDDLGKSYREVTEHEALAMKTITDSSQQLAEMFMSALASVQFQDVTRQQIGQAIDALYRLDEHSALLAARLEKLEDTQLGVPPLNNVPKTSSCISRSLSSAATRSC